MGVCLQQWRVSLGVATSTLLKNEDFHRTGFYGLVLEMLLVVAGVEPNPGPVNEGSCELCGKLLTELLNSIDTKQKTLSEREESLKILGKRLTVLEKELAVKEQCLTKKMELFKLAVKESKFLAELETAFKSFESGEEVPNEGISADPAELEEAVCKGKWLNVQKILKTGKISVEYRFEDRKTALLLASEHGHLAIVRYLIEEADAHKTVCDNKLGMYASHWACHNGHYEVVRYLTKEIGIDPACLTVYGETALHIACKGGHLNIVRFLLDECGLDLHAKDHGNWNAIHFAAKYGHLHIVEYLVKRLDGTPIGVTNDGDTALHLAAMENHLDVVMYLVNSGSGKKDVKNKVGWTPASCSSYGTVVSSFLS